MQVTSCPPYCVTTSYTRYLLLAPIGSTRRESLIVSGDSGWPNKNRFKQYTSKTSPSLFFQNNLSTTKHLEIQYINTSVRYESQNQRDWVWLKPTLNTVSIEHYNTWLELYLWCDNHHNLLTLLSEESHRSCEIAEGVTSITIKKASTETPSW